MAVISRASVRTLASFGREFGVSFTVLADPRHTVRGSLYRLRGNPTVIIIDKEGAIRYSGGFTTWQKMEEEIELIRNAAESGA
jgi:peroxiredoxin